MKHEMKLIALLGALALAAFVGKAADKPATKPADAAAPKISSLFPDEVIAKGKGVEVKRSALDEAFIALKSNAAAQGQNIPESQRPILEARLLDRLIITQVLTNKATVADKAKARESTDKFIGDTKKKLPNEEAFQRELIAMGMTLDQFQKRVLEQAIAEAVLDRELKNKITISDERLKKFYDENPKQFEQPETVRASHVLLATKDPATRQDLSTEQKMAKKATAEKVLARAKKGEDFTVLVKEFSEDPGSKDKGGEYTFPRGQMVPEFEAAAFSLNQNQISDIVTTAFGFHIIKLLEKMPPKKLEFAKVADQLKEEMMRDELQKQMPDYFDKIKKEAGIEVLDKSLILPPMPKDDPALAPAAPPDKPDPAKPEKK